GAGPGGDPGPAAGTEPRRGLPEPATGAARAPAPARRDLAAVRRAGPHEASTRGHRPRRPDRGAAHPPRAGGQRPEHRRRGAGRRSAARHRPLFRLPAAARGGPRRPTFRPGGDRLTPGGARPTLVVSKVAHPEITPPDDTLARPQV